MKRLAEEERSMATQGNGNDMSRRGNDMSRRSDEMRCNDANSESSTEKEKQWKKTNASAR